MENFIEWTVIAQGFPLFLMTEPLKPSPLYKCKDDANKTLLLQEGMEIFTRAHDLTGLTLQEQFDKVFQEEKEGKGHPKKWKIETRISNPGMCRCANHREYLVMVDKDKNEKVITSGFPDKIFTPK